MHASGTGTKGGPAAAVGKLVERRVAKVDASSVSSRALLLAVFCWLAACCLCCRFRHARRACHIVTRLVTVAQMPKTMPVMLSGVSDEEVVVLVWVVVELWSTDMRF